MIDRRRSSIFYPALLVLFAFTEHVISTTTGCKAVRFRDTIGSQEKDDFLIYGITQDCQLFFVRSYQLDYLNTIQVDPRNGYCSPSVVQLHISSATTILLLMRQGPTRLCTLELNIPPPEILFGNHVFRYSLVTAIRFLVCSHAQDFHLDPAQTFLDTAFQDVIYAIDGDSRGSQWMAKQLVLRNGTLRLLNSVTFDHYPTDPRGADAKVEAKEFVIASDSARKSLTVVNRQTRAYTKSCLFDLLFRPHAVKVERGQIENPFGGGATLHSVSTDGNIMVMGEEKRAGQYTTSTFVYAMNSSSTPNRMHCIAQMDFAAEVGVIRISTLNQMLHEPLPKFSPHKKKDFHRRISEEFGDDQQMEKEIKDRDRETNRVQPIRPDISAKSSFEKITTKKPNERIEERPENGNEFSVEAVDHNKALEGDEDEDEEERKELEESKAERHHDHHHKHQTTTALFVRNAEGLTQKGDHPTAIPPEGLNPSGSPTNDTLTSVSSPFIASFFNCASILISAFLLQNGLVD